VPTDKLHTTDCELHYQFIGLYNHSIERSGALIWPQLVVVATEANSVARSQKSTYIRRDRLVLGWLTIREERAEIFDRPSNSRCRVDTWGRKMNQTSDSTTNDENCLLNKPFLTLNGEMVGRSPDVELGVLSSIPSTKELL